MKRFVIYVSYAVLLLVTVAVSYLEQKAPPVSIELAFSDWLQLIVFPGLQGLMVALTWLGQTPVAITIVFATSAVLFLARLRLEAFFVLTTAVVDVVSRYIKDFVGRPRPTPDLVQVFEQNTDLGYPSGHAVHALVFFGFLAYLTYTLLKSPVLKYSIMALLLGMMVLTGVSRIFLGAHWLGDVLGGYAIGALWLFIVIAAYRSVRHRLVDKGWYR